MERYAPQPDDRRINLRVSRPTWRRLKQIATDREITITDLLNEWIDQRLAAEGEAGGSGAEGVASE